MVDMGKPNKYESDRVPKVPYKLVCEIGMNSTAKLEKIFVCYVI